MDNQVLYNALTDGDYSSFKKSLNEDLENKLSEYILKNEDFKMLKQYDRSNHLSRYIRGVINEAEDADDTNDVDKEKIAEALMDAISSLRNAKRYLREAEADTDDVEDAIEEAEDAVDGDEDDDIEENMKKAKKKIKEAEEELADVSVDDDDDEVIEKLTKASNSIKKAKKKIKEAEDEIEGSTDDVRESRRYSRRNPGYVYEDEIEGSTDDVKCCDDEIEGSTDDVKESIRTITSKLREAEAEIDDVDKERTDVDECLKYCRNAYVKVKNAVMSIKHLGNTNINESSAPKLADDASRLNKVLQIFEELDDDVDPNREDEVKEAAINFKKAIAKAVSILEKCGSKKVREEDDDEEEEEITESYSSSLIKRMNRLI